jgi:hypothetical protein
MMMIIIILIIMIVTLKALQGLKPYGGVEV